MSGVTQTPQNQSQQESIPFDKVLQKYRERVAELEHTLVLMECRIESRDEQIESLLRELDRPHPLPDVPHN